MRLKLLLTLLFVTFVAKANDIGIKVILSDGSSMVFLIDEDPVAKFIDDALVIKSKEKEMTVNLNDGSFVQVLFIGNETAISEVRNGVAPIFHITDEGLEESHLMANSDIYLYDVRGILIAKAVADQEGRVKIPLNDDGVYIVKTSVTTIKIRK